MRITNLEYQDTIYALEPGAWVVALDRIQGTSAGRIADYEAGSRFRVHTSNERAEVFLAHDEAGNRASFARIELTKLQPE